MKQKNNEGFSLVEILAGMAILALIVLPTCTGMVMSFRLNAKTNQMLQAQLAVSSAVETLMAEGYSEANAAEIQDEHIKIDAPVDGNAEKYCKVIVSYQENGEELISVTTHMRKAG